ncbi:MAG TPA: hypothetical protein VFC47_15430 [Caulobacteraceae bacterium]|nr:hypothetical protein [Caulobacteraceae bacterium]
MTMNEDRRRVLAMLAEGKITTDEAERLLNALEGAGPRSDAGLATARAKGAPKYMRVTVEASEAGEKQKTVNIRVPMQLLRAGVRLSSLMPPHAREKVNEAMRRQGLDMDINQLKPENLDALIGQMGDLSIDVDHQRAKVRIFCE